MLQVVERQTAQFTLDALGANPLQRGSPVELPFIQPHDKTQPDLIQVIFVMNVRAPQPVALFQPERVKCAAARSDQTQRFASLPKRIPRLQPVFVWSVDF